MIKYIKEKYPDKLVIGGNISTPEACKGLEEEGLNSYRCGQALAQYALPLAQLGYQEQELQGFIIAQKQLK